MENPIQILLRSIVSNEVDEEELRRTAQCTLELQQVPKDASLTIVITDDDEIQALNRQFRDVDAPTDVLAFSDIEDGGAFVNGSGEPLYLGDVIVSLPRARQQAAERGCSTLDEMRLLVVHGLLHLLGYDHATPDEEAEMWSRQDVILDQVAE